MSISFKIIKFLERNVKEKTNFSKIFTWRNKFLNLKSCILQVFKNF